MPLYFGIHVSSGEDRLMHEVMHIYRHYKAVPLSQTERRLIGYGLDYGDCLVSVCCQFLLLLLVAGAVMSIRPLD